VASRLVKGVLGNLISFLQVKTFNIKGVVHLLISL